ncbi:MAG: response regulator [Candidatus Hydrogenedentota bacterium]
MIADSRARHLIDRAMEALTAGRPGEIIGAMDELAHLGGSWIGYCAACSKLVREWEREGAAMTADLIRGALEEASEGGLENPQFDDCILKAITERLELFLPEDPGIAGAGESEIVFDYADQDGANLDLFVEESKEQLEKIEEGILSLSQDPGAVDKLFRAMHTLKGSSGMLGARAINRLAHAAEEVLSGVRDGAVAPTLRLEKALLAAKDLLADGVARIEERLDPEIDVESAIDALRSRDGAGADVPASAKESPAARRADEPPQGEAKTRVSKAASSIRVDARKLDELFERMGEAVISRIRIDERMRRVDRILTRPRGERTWSEVEELFAGLRQSIEEGDRVQSAVQERVMVLRLAPLETVFRRFPRTIRETAASLGKEIDYVISGGDVELDKSICEAIADPLIHMIRNAIDHGIESPEERIDRGKPPAGTLKLSASYQGDRVLIEMADDGRGIDADRIAAKALEKKIVSEEELARMDERSRLLLIFRAGFSTAEQVTALSGRGVGMDVVRETIERLKGSVNIESAPGEGTRVTLSLPLTLALVNLLLVRCGDTVLAFPLHVVRETLKVSREEIRRAGDQAVIRVRNAFIPLIPLAEILGLPSDSSSSHHHLVVVEVMGQTAAISVTRLMERCEAVLKPLGGLLSSAPFVSGTTILGDGRVVPVLDPVPLLAAARECAASEAEPVGAGKKGSAGKILVAEDSPLMARRITAILSRAGFVVTHAADGEQAFEAARTGSFDLVATDIEMPGCDGYEFCRRLRKDDAFKFLPVIAVTTHTDKVDRIKGFEAGFDEYLAKPVDEAILLGTIDRLLARRPHEPIGSR